MKYPFILIAMAAGIALGKSAEDYLHDASYKYIAGRHQEAAVEVEDGLRENPGDPRLHLLDDLLKQMKDQQRKDQNQSGGGSQDKQNKQDKQDQKNQQNKQNGDGSKQDQQNKPGDKDSSGQDKDKNKDGDQGKNQQPPQPKPEEAKADSAGRDSSGRGGQPQRLPGQMSKEEAERLLNSFVNEEEKAHKERQGTTRKRAATDQDW